MILQSSSRICGIESILPKGQVLNEAMGYDQDWINRIGINSRYIANPSDRVDGFARLASVNLCNRLSWSVTDIDVCVVITQTPDSQLPGTAIHLQHLLGLREEAICFDINLGCSGYPYGLYVVGSLLEKTKGKGLLITGDFSSRIIDPLDAATLPIFSDGIAVTALAYEAESSMMFSLHTDGQGSKAIHCPYQGALTMDGMAVFSFALAQIPMHIKKFLEETAIDPSDIDQVFLHQANKMISEGIIRRLNWSKASFPTTLMKYGNTSSASIPITICDHYANTSNALKKLALLTGFGVGLSWGSALVHLDNDILTNTVFK